MLKIALCDDEEGHLKQIEDMVIRILFDVAEFQIVKFPDGARIIEAIQNGTFQFDLLLLDIHMTETDGMETARYIRMHDVDVDILFLTVDDKYVYDGYTYRAFSYLLKPVSFSQLQKELERYVRERSSEEYQCLQVNVRGYTYKLRLNKLDYLESLGRKIQTEYQGEMISFYGKMAEMEEALAGTDFVRCHQSYMVNLNKVITVKRQELLLANRSIPVSRKYYEEIRRLWQENNT